MNYRFSKKSYDTLKSLKDPHVQSLMMFDDENSTIEISDREEFEMALFEVIPIYGMTQDFADVTQYGRDLYTALDEFTYYKA